MMTNTNGVIKLGVCKDLRGLKFGRLTVVDRADNYVTPRGVQFAQWICMCDCGKEKPVIVTSYRLTSGNTKSCGCLRNEKSGERGHKQLKKYNDYEIQDDYVIMYTTKGEPFFVDLEDFWKVKDICWSKDKDGYLVGSNNGKGVKLHRLIMDCPDNMVVDHKHRKESRNDNRKENLRIATTSQNCMNREMRFDNTSGITGVSYDKDTQKWCVQIGVEHKNIWIGSYKNKDDAIAARQNAEKKYFGEWRYINSENERGEVQ